MGYLRLVRWANLLIIAIIQGVLFFKFIPAIVQKDFFNLITPYLLVTTATIFAAIFGNIHNDILDQEVDQYNNKAKTLLQNESFLPHRIMTYSLITSLILSIIADILLDQFWIILMMSLAVISLYLYNISFKKIAGLGNIIIALNCAGVPFIVMGLIFEEFLNPSNSVIYINLIIIYLYFAFVITIAREIIKDIIDMEGDRQVFYRTLPIVVGIPISKLIAIALLLLLLTGSYWWENNMQYEQTASSQLLLWVIMLSILFTIVLVVGARRKQHFFWSSQMMKLTMFLGLLYLIIF